MVFSWQNAVKRGLKAKKARIEILKKVGKNSAADKVKREIDEVKKQFGIS